MILVAVASIALPAGHTADASLRGTVTNLSTRGFVETGDGALIGGFIVRGGAARVAIRAIGAGLAERGIRAPLEDPRIEVFRDGASLIANDDWQSAPNAAEVEDAGLAPQHSRDAAVLTTLPAGHYSAVVRGARDQQGVALLEMFWLEGPGTFANVSTRGVIGADEKALIGGVIIGGKHKTVVSRVLGGKLCQEGLSGCFARAAVSLQRQGQVLPESGYTPEVRQRFLSEYGFESTYPQDDVQMHHLSPGEYTLVARATPGDSGIGIVEIFDVDELAGVELSIGELERMDIPVDQLAVSERSLLGVGGRCRIQMALRRLSCSSAVHRIEVAPRADRLSSPVSFEASDDRIRYASVLPTCPEQRCFAVVAQTDMSIDALPDVSLIRFDFDDDEITKRDETLLVPSAWIIDAVFDRHLFLALETELLIVDVGSDDAASVILSRLPIEALDLHLSDETLFVVTDSAISMYDIGPRSSLSLRESIDIRPGSSQMAWGDRATVVSVEKHVCRDGVSGFYQHCADVIVVYRRQGDGSWDRVWSSDSIPYVHALTVVDRFAFVGTTKGLWTFDVKALVPRYLSSTPILVAAGDATRYAEVTSIGLANGSLLLSLLLDPVRGLGLFSVH